MRERELPVDEFVDNDESKDDAAVLCLSVTENVEETLPPADRELGRIRNYIPGRRETLQDEIDDEKKENGKSQSRAPGAD